MDIRDDFLLHHVMFVTFLHIVVTTPSVYNKKYLFIEISLLVAADSLKMVVFKVQCKIFKIT